MAQIAAEELGLPLARCGRARRLRARPVRIGLGGLLDASLDGPGRALGGRRRRRQIIELAAQRWQKEQRTLSLKGGRIVCSDGGAWPLENLPGCSRTRRSSARARGPNPTGMRVLTFGVQVAEVAVDIGTGEVRVGRIAAIHDVGRIVNPLGARSQVEGGIVQAIGHTLPSSGCSTRETGTVLTQTLDAYKLPTIADVPEIVCEFIDEPDSHLTNLGSKGLGEPPIMPTAAAIANAIRDATGADVRSLPIDAGGDAAGARRGARRKETVAAPRPDRSRKRRSARGRRRRPRRRHRPRAAVARRDRRKQRRSSSSAPSSRTGVAGQRIGAGTTLADLEADPEIPAALREACRARGLAAARARWARSAATSCRRRAAGTGGSSTRASCTAATRATRGRGSTGSTRSSATSAARRPIPPIRPRRCWRWARRPDRSPRARGRRLYRLPTDDDRDVTALEPGELILELDVPRPSRAST